MKNKKYLSKILPYGVAVFFAAFIFWAILVKFVDLAEGYRYFALISAFITLGGDIALLVNYLKKSSKAWLIFPIIIIFISAIPLGIFIGYTIVTHTITSIICIIALAIYMSLNLFIFFIESDKETDLSFAEMNRKTNEDIAEMRWKTDKAIAKMR